MDSYIRDFRVKKIDTLLAKDKQQLEALLNEEKITDLKIFHNNIRSLNKNYDELSRILKDRFRYNSII